MVDTKAAPATIHHTSSAQTKQTSRDAPGSAEAKLLSTISAPTNKDILSGRGRVVDQHPGNRVFRRFIKEAADKYSHRSTPRAYKPLISKAVRQQLENEGMRLSRGIMIYPAPPGENLARKKLNRRLDMRSETGAIIASTLSQECLVRARPDGANNKDGDHQKITEAWV
jgi:hypothetical protein